MSAEHLACRSREPRFRTAAGGAIAEESQPGPETRHFCTSRNAGMCVVIASPLLA